MVFQIKCFLFPFILLAAYNTAYAELSPAEIQAARNKYLDLMQVREGWASAGNLPVINIGIIDTGFDYSHPAMVGRIDKFYSYEKKGVFHENIFDMIAHGNGTASIIASTGILVGLCPNCRLLAAEQGIIAQVPTMLRRKYRLEHPKVTVEEAMRAVALTNKKEITQYYLDWQDFILDSLSASIRKLADSGVKVINVSMNIDDKDGKFNKAVQYALNKDVVIVQSAGNNSVETTNYPGDTDNMIVVGGTLLDDTRWDSTIEGVRQGSNYGARLTVMAPIVNVVWAAPHDITSYASHDGPFGTFDHTSLFDGQTVIEDFAGTSSAAPMVTSLAGMVRSLRPDLTARDVVSIIKNGADDIGEKGFDIYTGWGRINFKKTLELAKTWKSTAHK